MRQTFCFAWQSANLFRTYANSCNLHRCFDHEFSGAWCATASTEPGGKMATFRADTAAGIDRQCSRYRAIEAADRLRRIHAALSEWSHSRRRFWRTGIECAGSRGAEGCCGEGAEEPRNCYLLRVLSVGSVPQRAPGYRAAAPTRLPASKGSRRFLQPRSGLDE